MGPGPASPIGAPDGDGSGLAYHRAIPLDEDHADRWWDDWPADLIFEYIEAEQRGGSDRLRLLESIATLRADLPVTES